MYTRGCWQSWWKESFTKFTHRTRRFRTWRAWHHELGDSACSLLSLHAFPALAMALPCCWHNANSVMLTNVWAQIQSQYSPVHNSLPSCLPPCKSSWHQMSLMMGHSSLLWCSVWKNSINKHKTNIMVTTCIWHTRLKVLPILLAADASLHPPPTAAA